MFLDVTLRMFAIHYSTAIGNANVADEHIRACDELEKILLPIPAE